MAHPPPGVAQIGPEPAEAGVALGNPSQHQHATIAIRHIGRMDPDAQDQAQGIDQQMALAPVHLLAAIPPTRPPCILVDVGFPIETRQIRAPLVQRDRKKA